MHTVHESEVWRIAEPGKAQRGARVLVVEDDDAICYGLTAALTDEGYAVTAAGTALQAVDSAKHVPPDLAIIDIGLPGTPDGLTLARQLRAEFRLPLMFVTARGSVQERLDGFEAGADDYVVKPFAMAELLARVRAVLGRHGHTSGARWEVGPLRVDQQAHVVTVGGREVSLTATEFELLLALVRHRGSVLSKAQLLSYVPAAAQARHGDVVMCPRALVPSSRPGRLRRP